MTSSAGRTSGARLSLWLEPADPEPLRRWIGEVAGEPLAAHVTLGSCVGEPERVVVAGAERIAARLAPVEFARTGFAAFGEIHRALVVLADRQAFGVAIARLRYELPQAERADLPHMSLMYGDPEPERLLAVLARVYGGAPMPEPFMLERLTVRDTTGDDHRTWTRCLGEWVLA